MKIIEKNTGVTGGGKGITYVDGKYYLVSDSPAKVCVSEDLTNWTEYQLNNNYMKPCDIAYGNGVFVISGHIGTTSSTYIYRSTDGINWTPIKLPTTVNFALYCNSVKFINNKLFLYRISKK